jgi:hypothetical protein
LVAPAATTAMDFTVIGSTLVLFTTTVDYVLVVEAIWEVYRRRQTRGGHECAGRLALG